MCSSDLKDEAGRNKIATDDARRWTRNARIYLGFDKDSNVDRMGNIPWGFGTNAFMAYGAQIAAYTSGDGVEFKDFGSNMIQITMDSFIPIPTTGISPIDNPPAFLMDLITPTLLKGTLEAAMNRNSLDQQIYRNTFSKYTSTYGASDVVPQYFKDASEYAFEFTNGRVTLSPDALYFYFNNYADGLSKIAESVYGNILVLQGKKYFNPEKDLFILDSFLSTSSNIDARKYDKIKITLEKKSKEIGRAHV